MKKFVLLTLAIVLSFTLIASATDTRVMTLGQVNNIVKDDANVFLYPSTINFYNDMVVAEVDGLDFFRFGAHYNLGEDNGVVGLYFDKCGIVLDPAFQPDNWFGDGVIDNRLQLIYGRPIGDNYLGVGLNFFSDSYVSEADGDDTEEKNLAFGIDVGLTMLEEKLDFAVGFMMGPNWTYIDAAGDDVTEPDGNMGINLGGRYWYEFNDEVMFVPHLGFDYMTAGVKDLGKVTDMTFDLGWGVNITPADNVLMLFDFGITYGTEKNDPEVGDATTDTEMTLPYFKGGLEGDVFDWWDVRFGAVKYWNSESVEDTYKAGWSDTHTYLGSGLHFGNLDIDVWMDPDFALNGPYFVSGNATAMAYQASLVYNIP